MSVGVNGGLQIFGSHVEITVQEHTYEITMHEFGDNSDCYEHSHVANKLWLPVYVVS